MVKNNNRPDRGRNRKAGNIINEIPEEELLAKQLKIRRRTKNFVDLLNSDPSISQTEAYIRTHDTNNRKTASIEASKLLSKPSVQIYSRSAVSKAKKRIVELVDSKNESIALKASDSILDRTEGKPTQKTENLSKTVEVKLDLTGSRIGNHYVTGQLIDQSEPE